MTTHEAQDKHETYTGKSGQMAVMSEFLFRGYNVAMPEVDTGDDIFVVHDERGALWRIQVKSGNGVEHSKGYSAKFFVQGAQVRSARTPDLDYIFVARWKGRWADSVILKRSELKNLLENHREGYTDRQSFTLSIYFFDNSTTLLNQNLQSFRNNWDAWPIVAPA